MYSYAAYSVTYYTIPQCAYNLSAGFVDTSSIQVYFNYPRNSYTGSVSYKLRTTDNLYSIVGTSSPLQLTGLTNDTSYNMVVDTSMNNGILTTTSIILFKKTNIIPQIVQSYTGATKTTSSDKLYNIYTFTNTTGGSIVISTSLSYIFYYLIVGGGGGGNTDYSGGGGGGVVTSGSVNLNSSTTLTITVGAGGTNGVNGGYSRIAYSSTNITANGGVCGSMYNNAINQTPTGGGSAGGGGCNGSKTVPTLTTETGKYYNNGGYGEVNNSSSSGGGGGGGGAGGNGSNASSKNAGSGGPGKLYNTIPGYISAIDTIVTGKYLGAGGGGGGYSPYSVNAGTGGSGVGGNGGSSGNNATNGTEYGAGGGGGAGANGQGGSGYKGIVVIAIKLL